MKVFLSAIEGSECYPIRETYPNLQMNWNLMSFFYMNKKSDQSREHIEWVMRRSKNTIIDSGAHSFRRGLSPKEGWEAYTRQYADWISTHDRPNCIGYFEMDVDNVVGYDEVKRLRRILERATDKIIPVWHRNRGVADYVETCREYSGRVVSITALGGDVSVHQLDLFRKVAWQNDCRIHCLGMTRKEVLDTVPFDYVDSSSWKQQGIRKYISKDIRQPANMHYKTTIMMAYLHAMKLQDHYYQKWSFLGRD